MSRNILKQSVIREQIFSDLDELSRQFGNNDLTAQKTAYLLQYIDSLEGKIVVSDDGKDVTNDFIQGLRNIIMNPAERDLLFVFKEVSEDIFMEPAKGYHRKPNCSTRDKTPFAIKYIPNGEIIGKALIRETLGRCEVWFMELRDDYKSKFYFSDILKDAVLDLTDYKTSFSLEGNYLGDPV